HRSRRLSSGGWPDWPNRTSSPSTTAIRSPSAHAPRRVLTGCRAGGLLWLSDLGGAASCLSEGSHHRDAVRPGERPWGIRTRTLSGAATTPSAGATRRL